MSQFPASEEHGVTEGELEEIPARAGSRRHVDLGTVQFETLAKRADKLAATSRRSILGICGAPGAGKTTLAQALATELGQRAQWLPMDGFHLATDELNRLGRRDIKGAPETFDVEGFAHLLTRLRSRKDEVVYAPSFKRALEEPIAASIAIRQDVPLVITEGNYLLLNQGPWSAIGGLLDECWYITVPQALRHGRLFDRHEAFGKTPAEARAWTLGSDERNAAVIETTRARADLVFSLSLL